jgi:hypothetical protein
MIQTMYIHMNKWINKTKNWGVRDKGKGE